MPKGFRDLAELHHVHATFAPLHFRYEALMAVQASGKLGLSDAGEQLASSAGQERPRKVNALTAW